MLFGVGDNASDSSGDFDSVNKSPDKKLSQSRSQFFPLQPELSCALAEQGVIPFLRCVISGFSVNDSVLLITTAIHSSTSSSSRFPELNIRRRVQLLLAKTTFSCESSLQVRQRVLQSLVYSGNTKLRLNIFTSVLVLCNSSAALGRFGASVEYSRSYLLFFRLLLAVDQPSVSATPLRSNDRRLPNFVLSFLFQLTENGDLKSVFTLLVLIFWKIIRVLRINLLQLQAREKRIKQRKEIATQTLESSSFLTLFSLSSSVSNSIHPRLLQLLLSFASSLVPVVIITPSPNAETASSIPITPNMIRMSCPGLDLLQRYGGKLFLRIKVNVFLRLAYCFAFDFLLETAFCSDGTVFYPFPAKFR
jgi:hypothetical protein